MKCACGEPLKNAKPIGVQEFNLHDRIVKLDLANCPKCKTTLVLKKTEEKKVAA